MTSQLKTFMLLALLSGLIIVLGGALGGKTGIVIAFGLALIMNVGSYWYSDKIVLRMYQARELSESEAPMIYSMVRELAANAQIPMPRIAVVPEEAPNAFATGRNPENSVVAVTEGILRLLSPEELKGVLAHEIAHIANRDILIQTVAGVMASTIVSIANFMQFAAIFGMGRSSEDGEGGGSNPLMAIVLAILAPIAASLIQFAISRSREYLADASGARYCGQPLALAAALGALLAFSLGAIKHVEEVPMGNSERMAQVAELEQVRATVKSLDSRMKAAGAASLSAIDVTDSERQDAQRAAELGITAGTADDDLRAMVPQTTPELRPVMPMLPRWVIFFLLPIIATIALNIEFSRGTTVAREIKRIRRHRKAQSAFESDPRGFLERAG